MIHPRKIVRDEFHDRISTITELGGRVFTSRVYPMQRAEMPGVLIYTNEETSEPLSEGHDRTMQREIVVTVEAVLIGDDDDIDALCWKIEKLIAADPQLDDYAEDCYLQSTQITTTGESEKRHALAKMDFLAVVFNNELTQDS